MSNYFVSKDSKSGEVLYLEFDKKNGYKVKPKVKKKGAIEVNKIVFVSPMLTEKLIKKKIDHKISSLLAGLNQEDDDGGDNGIKVRDNLMEAERLKLNIINNYGKYLGGNYTNLTLKKVELIINSYRSKLFTLREKKQNQMLIQMFNNFTKESEEELSDKKGKGR
ncbi:MAG: hypothetical protein ACI31S_05335 [Bacilli bacterium]